MATKRPEFITLLRTIRDEYYPDMDDWYQDVLIKHAQVVTLHGEVVTMHDEVEQVWSNIREITVKKPVTSVPNKPDGSPGDPDVNYDPINNEFSFQIPVGAKGDSMDIDYAVDTIADRDNLTGVLEGEICYVDETQMIYVMKSDGTWSAGLVLTPASTFISLTDTPIEYTGASGKIPTVDSSESQLIFSGPEELGIVGFNYVDNPRFDNPDYGINFIIRAIFGSDRGGYAGFTTFTGSPTLNTGDVTFDGTNDMTNPNASISGRSGLSIHFTLNAVSAGDLIDADGMGLRINASNRFEVWGMNNGVESQITLAALDLATATEYLLFGDETGITCFDLTNNTVSTQIGSITVTEDSYGPGMTIGTGIAMSVMDAYVYDRTEYQWTDGVPMRLAQGRYKYAAGADIEVYPTDPSLFGVTDAQLVFSRDPGNLTEGYTDIRIGGCGDFSGKTLTYSFAALSIGTAPIVTLQLVNDTASTSGSTRYYIQDVTQFEITSGLKEYKVTFDADTLDADLYKEIGHGAYMRIVFPNASDFYVVSGHPKLELGNVQTPFTPQVKSPSWGQIEAIIEGSIGNIEIDPSQIVPQGSGSTLDADKLDGYEASALPVSGPVQAELNDLSSRISSNDTDISGLDSRVSTNETDISSLQGRMGNAEADINTLEGQMTDVINELGQKVTGSWTWDGTTLAITIP